ncbi:NADH-ubiquinone oxidoreductase [Histoplasma capsulatum G186AR]|nr:NADH-ubiquinone oxidoreductase [Histoplasma capsulatum G186AR]
MLNGMGWGDGRAISAVERLLLMLLLAVHRGNGIFFFFLSFGILFFLSFRCACTVLPTALFVPLYRERRGGGEEKGGMREK